MDIDSMQQEAGFVLEDGDRFHSILSSGDIGFESCTDMVAVITFFVIRRASSNFDIICIHKTFSVSECVSRAIQRKTCIPQGSVDAEMRLIRDHFAAGVNAATGVLIDWKILDLSSTTDPAEQVRLIRGWGRVGVMTIPRCE